MTDIKGNIVNKDGKMEGISYVSSYDSDKVVHLNGYIHAHAYQYSYFPEDDMISKVVAESEKILKQTEEKLKVNENTSQT